jgi:hypothetical protein
MNTCPPLPALPRGGLRSLGWRAGRRSSRRGECVGVSALRASCSADERSLSYDYTSAVG